MKATTVIFSLIAGASAGCFGGELFEDKNNAKYNVERACDGYDGVAGALQGFYNPGEAKSFCVQSTPTQRLDVLVQNLNTAQGFDIGDPDCVFRLENIINGCDRGGQDDVSGWRFKVDPNKGIC
ncbi:hypothetical protein E0Z10_g3901 [Xylaria hypoxylon]|uniref:Ecp2 effector protein domain-containing protein n=1 Tax=Xylaria hypoxylon TaxID=37992 RepID=A0A4Z0Z8G9_9PEZI|nr:hypothetical protein E0Z10_g3901 [Xylaria hypoxylon]